MREFTMHPTGTVPETVFENAMRVIADYTVSFTVGGMGAGAGTLVSIGADYGILTAWHVADCIVNRREKTLTLGIAEHKHWLQLESHCFEHIVVGKPDFKDRPSLGPDLSVIRLLDYSVVSTIRSKKSFYPLDRHTMQEFDGMPLQELNWFIAGAPEEFAERFRDSDTGERVRVTTHWIGNTDFHAIHTRGAFDFVTIETHSGEHGFPNDFGGVSGGGIWIVLPTMNPKIGITSISHAPPFLAGVAFYQGPASSGLRQIIAHGPTSLAQTIQKVKERV